MGYYLKQLKEPEKNLNCPGFFRRFEEKFDYFSSKMLRIFRNLRQNEVRETCKFFSNTFQWNCRRNFARGVETECEPAVFTTRIAVPTDYSYVLKFMCDSYFKCEPTMVNIGLANEDPSPVLTDLMYKNIKTGLTIITLNEEGCIVGAAVNTRMSWWIPKQLRETANCVEDKDVANVLRFFAKIADAPNLWKTYNINQIFECSCVAVDQKHQGAGIATKLIQDSWMLARDCGFRLFRIDCSSKYTSKIANKLGYECVASIPYSSHVDCGEFIFKNITKPHDTLDIYIDRPLEPLK